jgi:peptidoglycan/LPS O-acetylase OafA/YrhL
VVQAPEAGTAVEAASPPPLPAVTGSERASGAAPSGGRFPYQPALDGIRAFAVLGVLAYHGNQSWASGGFLGVDAFFVLSGYLITSLLVTEFGSRGTIALSAFYARRARRLLPALFLVLAFVLVFGAIAATADQLDNLRADVASGLGYVANWRLLFSGQSYFDQFGAPSPLRHLWSLGIEEQWYFIWPAVLFVMLRWWRSLRAVLAVTVVLALSSAVLMLLLFEPGTDPARVYYGTDTRAQSLLVGAALALLLVLHGPLRSKLARRALAGAAIVAAAGTLWTWSATNDVATELYQGGFLVRAIAVAVVIAAVVQPGTWPMKRALAWAPLRWIGMISYGLYLFHWPIYLWLTGSRTGLHGPALLAVRVTVTFAAAIASYYLVERPVRIGALTTRRLWVLGGVCVVTIAGCTTLVTAGAPQGVGIDPRVASSADSFKPHAPVQAAAAPPETTRILVLGDSVAWSLRSLTDPQFQSSHNVVIDDESYWMCSLGLAPYRWNNGRVLSDWGPACDWQARMPAIVNSFQPQVAVAMFGPWEVFDKVVDGHLLEVGTPQHDAWYQGVLSRAAEVLGSRGALVVFVTSPSFERDESVHMNEPWGPSNKWRVDHINDLVRAFVAAHPVTTRLIEFGQYVCPSSPCRQEIDGVTLRSDGVHFDQASQRQIADWLVPQFVAETRSVIAP